MFVLNYMTESKTFILSLKVGFLYCVLQRVKAYSRCLLDERCVRSCYVHPENLSILQLTFFSTCQIQANKMINLCDYK